MTRPIAILLALLGVVVIVLGAHRARAADTAVVVTACGTPPVTYIAGQLQPMLQNVGGSLCTLGGGGGGGGGPVTAGVGSFVDGWSVTDGVTTDTVCATDTGTCTEVALFKRNNARLTTINTTLGGLFPAGGSIGNTSFGISGTLPAFAAIPAFKIDQTTPGTTNAVRDTSLPATVDTNAGAAGVSTIRTVIATGGATVPISAASLPLPTGAMASTGGTVGIVAGAAIVGKISQVDSAGTDSTDTTNHAVRVNVVAGGAGGGAVTVADGADVTLGSKADAKSAATDVTPITAMQVLKEISAMAQAPASTPVTNAGTFATQLTTALPAGSAVIGHVINDAGTAVIGKVGIDQTTPGTTNGVVVNAALPAGTNVIGHTITDSGSVAATTTVDGGLVTLGAKADAKSTATDTTAITVMQVLKEISSMEQAPASRAVTNAGTFAVQSTLAAGSAIVGKVGIDQTTPGTTNGVQVNAGAAIIGKISQVDSGGVDATDPTNHAVNVNCTVGCAAAITNYAQETGGNLDLQTTYLLALKNAIGSAVPGNLHCQSTALASNLVCGAAGARSLVDFTVTADSTLNASAWYVMIFDATALPANGAVTPIKCYQVPSGQSQFGGNFSTGGVNVTNGLVMGVSSTGCFSLTASTHALFFGASYQ